MRYFEEGLKDVACPFGTRINISVLLEGLAVSRVGEVWGGRMLAFIIVCCLESVRRFVATNKETSRPIFSALQVERRSR